VRRVGVASSFWKERVEWSLDFFFSW